MTMKINYEEAIASVREDLRENAQRAATAVQTALKALENEDAQLARAVIDGDTAIDLAENAIEEKCLDILALDGPVATDLRRVVTILKTNAQIERLGDLATNIAEDIVYLKTAEIVRHELPKAPHAVVSLRRLSSAHGV